MDVIDSLSGYYGLALIMAGGGAYILNPTIVAAMCCREDHSVASLQFIVAILVGVLLALIGLFTVLQGSPGLQLSVGGFVGATYIPGIILGLLVADGLASRRSRMPTLFERFRKVSSSWVLGACAAIALAYLVVTVGPMYLSHAIYGRVGEPFVTGAFALAHIAIPVALARLRPRVSFEANTLFMLWGLSLAAGVISVGWVLSESLGDLTVHVLGFREAELVGPYLIFLPGGLLLSMGLLRVLMARDAPGQAG